MSRVPKDGPRWLDSLARWSVRGAAYRPSPTRPELTVTAVSGTTRRAALRRAAGAAGALAVVGPLGLAEAPPASAAVETLSKCQSESFNLTYDDFQKCTKEPLEEFDGANFFLQLFEERPRSKNPRTRRLEERTHAKQTRRRERAVKNLEFCNAAWARDRAEGEEKCQSSLKPPNEPPGGTLPSGPGCEPGFLLCGDYCCNLAYATCQGCSTPTCCRIEGKCCPAEVP